MKEKIQRLKKVLSTILLCYNNEHNFDRLYALLLAEYQIEGRVNEEGLYWKNLKQTINKQAEEYISKKKRRPKRGAPDEYESFVRNFKHDVTNEINQLKLQ